MEETSQHFLSQHSEHYFWCWKHCWYDSFFHQKVSICIGLVLLLPLIWMSCPAPTSGLSLPCSTMDLGFRISCLRSSLGLELRLFSSSSGCIFFLWWVACTSIETSRMSKPEGAWARIHELECAGVWEIPRWYIHFPSEGSCGLNLFSWIFNPSTFVASPCLFHPWSSLDPLGFKARECLVSHHLAQWFTCMDPCSCMDICLAVIGQPKGINGFRIHDSSRYWPYTTKGTTLGKFVSVLDPFSVQFQTSFWPNIDLKIHPFWTSFWPENGSKMDNFWTEIKVNNWPGNGLKVDKNIVYKKGFENTHFPVQNGKEMA